VATLSLRALNRATLARQLLLERHAIPPLEAVERLAGLQSQLPRPPFGGLWSRVAGFEREQLVALARDRQVVRATMMRGTLHLVSTRDFLALRGALQPVLSAGMTSILRGRTSEIDLDRLVAVAREILAERPRPFDELRPLLAQRGLGDDERALGFAVRMLLPLVLVPEEGAAWGWSAKAPFAAARDWLGAEPATDAAPRALVLRYLAAFGPATAADVGAWSGLRGMRAALDALRAELWTGRDEAGRELFDLPDAPRPDPDVPAPPRFLPEYDNLMLAHDDRTRVLPPEHRSRVVSKNLQVAATFLLDGMVAGSWKATRTRGVATITLTPFGKLTKAQLTALEPEALGMLRFVEPEAKAYAVTSDE
jgi:hypothetical protein